MKQMTGNIDGSIRRINSLDTLYSLQTSFQKNISQNEVLPQDNLQGFQYHITAMIEELGELLQADKRWKTHRNVKFDNDEKLAEYADVFITALNIAIHSGFTSDEVFDAVLQKICENNRRLESNAGNSGRN